MKSVKSIILTLLLVMSASAAHAGGLFRFGPKVGLTVNELHFNSSTFDGSNKTGDRKSVV